MTTGCLATGPLAGQWTYSVYTRDFSGTNQTGTINSGSLQGTGYVDDFNVLALRNTLAGTAQGTDQNDFGVIYQSTLNITSSGTYTFGVTSDDGSAHHPPGQFGQCRLQPGQRP